MHLQAEMKLDLSAARYVVFDEADRLFEMGFAPQLTEILHFLPEERQTLLFSATLPKSLVEFSKVGLQEPTLIRLDGESKMSPDLQSAFFSVKSAEKEGALLHILQDIIKVPTGQTEAAANETTIRPSKKRKRTEANDPSPKESPTKYSTIIFASTKHHVDYITSLLRVSGYSCSHVYGSLDQTARKQEVHEFRTGRTHIMVVTDVAARGIDIPILANVINYDFPSQPKVFIHRIGRTARAGKTGWSYSLVTQKDTPYLLDLQLFLGKRLIIGRSNGERVSYAEDVVIGTMAREKLAGSTELVAKALDENTDLAALRTVAGKGEKLYLRTRNSASNESSKRAKSLTASKNWLELHPLFSDNTDVTEVEREEMLARISGFRPAETIFEIGRRGQQGIAGEVVKRQRRSIQAKKRKIDEAKDNEDNDASEDEIAAKYQNPLGRSSSDSDPGSDSDDDSASNNSAVLSADSSSDFEVTVTHPTKPGHQKSRAIRDSTHYMSYNLTSSNPYEDRGYGVHSGGTSNPHTSSSFLNDARHATLDLGTDEASKSFAEPSRAGMRWGKNIPFHPSHPHH